MLIAVIGIIGTVVGAAQVHDRAVRTGLLVLCFMLIAAAICLLVMSYIGIWDSFHNLTVLRSLRVRRLFADGTTGSKYAKARIRSAKSIKIMAVSAHALIMNLKEDIIHSLAANSARVEVLLAAPDSEFVSDVEDTESSERAGHISAEIRAVESLLRECLKEARRIAEKEEAEVGRVWLGKYTTHLRSSLILCDESWGKLTLNLPPSRALQSPSLELVGGKGSLLERCLLHFRTVWDQMGQVNNVREVSEERLRGRGGSGLAT